MEDLIHHQLVPDVKVRVTQQIAARDHAWSSQTSGTVVNFQQKPTGSWFAHGKNGKLWLDRLTLKKDDGELTTLNLDEFSAVEIQK